MNIFIRERILSKLDIESKIIVGGTCVQFLHILKKYRVSYSGNQGFTNNLIKIVNQYRDWNYHHINDISVRVCRSGYLDMLKIMLRMFNLNIEMDLLPEACHANNLEMIKLLTLSDNTDYTFGLETACYTGNLDVLELLISICANKKIYIRYTDCLYYACQRNQIKIVNYLIQVGNKIDYDNVIQGACESGNIELVDLILDKGATDLNMGLFGACSIKNKQIINYMIAKGATECEWCDKSLEEHLAV